MNLDDIFPLIFTSVFTSVSHFYIAHKDENDESLKIEMKKTLEELKTFTSVINVLTTVTSQSK